MTRFDAVTAAVAAGIPDSVAVNETEAYAATSGPALVAVTMPAGMTNGEVKATAEAWDALGIDIDLPSSSVVSDPIHYPAAVRRRPEPSPNPNIFIKL